MRSAVLVLMGRTASGKTSLALQLAERFNAEIVSADSRQIYRGMPIGTAAPTHEERSRVRHHLVDFLDPAERYSAARFVEDALAAIDDIHARGKRAIVVGGTGFYLRTLTGDVVLSPHRDDGVRERLAREARVHPSEFLHDWLTALAPSRAAALEPNDPYRVTRALEIALAERISNPRETAEVSNGSLRGRGLTFRKVLVDVDDDALSARIGARVDAMLADGLVEEARRIGETAIAADAVGYREALSYDAGFSTHDELRTALIRTTRRYAKRQATWFRRESNVEAVEGDGAFGVISSIAEQLPGWS